MTSLLDMYLIPLFIFVSKAVFFISGTILSLAILYGIWVAVYFLAKESWKLIAANYEEAPYGTVLVVAFVMFICSSVIVLGTGV